MQYAGEISAICAAFVFSACALLYAAASHRIGSFSMSHFRMIFILMFVIMLQLLMKGGLFPEGVSAANWVFLAMSGLTGFFLCDALLFQSYVDATPRIGILVFNTYPFIGTFLAWIFLREKLSIGALIGIMVTMMGVIWAITGRDRNNVGEHRGHYKRGITLAAGASILQAISFLFAKPAMEGPASSDPLTATLIRAIFGCAGFWIVSLVRGRLGTIIGKGSDLKAMLPTLIGAAAAAGGVWLSMIAVKLAPIGIATTLMSLMPVTVLPMVVVINKERLSCRAIVGASIACLGVVILFNV